MPELDAYLHYRLIDVSSIKELVRRWYPRVYFSSPPKRGNHRALADARESIAELRYYREAVMVPGAGPSSDEARGIAAQHVVDHAGPPSTDSDRRPTARATCRAAAPLTGVRGTPPTSVHFCPAAATDDGSRRHRRGHGGCSSAGRAPGCGPGGRGFKSRHSPQVTPQVSDLPTVGAPQWGAPTRSFGGHQAATEASPRPRRATFPPAQAACAGRVRGPVTVRTVARVHAPRPRERPTMSWIEQRGAQHRVYWRTVPGRQAPKQFEPFGTLADAERFRALVDALGGDVDRARAFVRSPAATTATAPTTTAPAGTRSDARRHEQPDPTGPDPTRTGVVTLEQIFELYLHNKSCRPRTITRYRRMFASHIAPYFGGDRDITTIRSGRYLDPRAPAPVRGADAGDRVNDWLAWLATRHTRTHTGRASSVLLSAKGIRGLHGLLSGALELATLTEPEPIIARNPCHASALPELVPTEMHFLERDGFEALFAQLTGVWQLLVLVLVSTGLRFGELAGLAGLDCGDVFLDARVPYLAVRKAWARGPAGTNILGLPKTMSSIRKVSLPDLLVPLLRAHIGDRPAASPVFRMPRGSRLHHGNVLSRHFRPAVLAAATASPLVPADFRIHDLRHTHASWLLFQGRSETSVARRLGHSSILTTQRYVHLLAGMNADDAAAIDEFLSVDLPELPKPVRLAMVDRRLPVLDIDDDDLAA